jgi:GGDEF domain-containing protein
LTPATATDSFDALESRELVERRRSHVDGHTTGYRLTNTGRRCVNALSKLPDPLRSAFGCLAAEELETVYRSAMKMIRTLQDDGLMPVSRMCVRCQYFDPYRFPDSPTPAALFAAADEALYRAKRSGKNCVVAADGGTIVRAHD